ncbi:MAG: LacI family DNA-binding transcriptional regulator [Eubacteriales bacterium]|nr:LacI family DNA-binding transcriptional regulator [Eubacteriales bacterium]
MAATIKDIRNETGLSLATISKYLNGGNVLPENREKIDRAIDKLHYQVNEMARGLVTNRTYTVGLIAQKISSIFNGTLMEIIGRELRKNGYGMLICDSSDDSATEADNIRFLLNKKVDGMLVIATSMDMAAVRPAVDAGVPIVFVDRWVPDSGLASVTLDNRKAAKEAVEYLIRNGHRDIALLGSREEMTGIEREKGYRDALEEAGIPIREEFVFVESHTLEHGYNGMKQILRQKEKPTAVLMTNYDINLGTVIAMNEMGVRCPEDISLIGIDDLLLPRIVKPSLTVMRQPMEEIGTAAAKLLLAEINGEETSEKQIMFDAELLLGNSVKNLNK